MGPFTEQKQNERAESIQKLLDTNPQISDYMKAIWSKHLMNLATNEDEYVARVKQIYSTLKPQYKGWVTYE